MTDVDVLINSKEYKRFKEVVLEKLHKGEGYRPVSTEFILCRLFDEFNELLEAVVKKKGKVAVQGECVDVACCAMIAFMWLEGFRG